VDQKNLPKNIVISILILVIFYVVAINAYVMIFSAGKYKGPIDVECCGLHEKMLGYRCVAGCGPPVNSVIINAETGEYEPEKIDIENTCMSPSQVISRLKHGCPICLSYDTTIDTPTGPVNVEDLEVGMDVWTIDGGKKVPRPLLKVSSIPVSTDYLIVNLVLEDGRELRASYDHPTTDDRIVIGELEKGMNYDGSVVLDVFLDQYEQDRTYDLLPDGETGYYWANDVLLGSTLEK